MGAALLLSTDIWRQFIIKTPALLTLLVICEKKVFYHDRVAA